MEEKIVERIIRQANIKKERRRFIKLLVKICIDNNIPNVEDKIITFLSTKRTKKTTKVKRYVVIVKKRNISVEKEKNLTSEND